MNHTLLDNNSFEFLTDEGKAQWFINATKTHAHEKMRRLGESLEHRRILKNPLSIIERIACRNPAPSGAGQGKRCVQRVLQYQAVLAYYHDPKGRLGKVLF